MNSVFVSVLGLGLIALSAALFLRRKWLVAGLPVAIATIAFFLLLQSKGKEALDFLFNAMLVLMILYIGIFPWTDEGKKHAAAAHLSIEGAKVLGGIFLFLGVGIVVGLFLQAFGF